MTLNLGDVMRELGDAPLKNHTWTQSILNTLNATLPSTTLLTEDSTGRQVLQAMAFLPDQERNVILTSSVDLIQGTFTLATSSADGKPSTDSKSQSFHQIVLNDLAANPSRALMLFFAAVMVIISLILAAVMSFTYAKTGKAPDTSLFQALIKALVDILNAFSSTGH